MRVAGSGFGRDGCLPSSTHPVLDGRMSATTTNNEGEKVQTVIAGIGSVIRGPEERASADHQITFLMDPRCR